MLYLFLELVHHPDNYDLKNEDVDLAQSEKDFVYNTFARSDVVWKKKHTKQSLIQAAIAYRKALPRRFRLRFSVEDILKGYKRKVKNG